MAQVSSESDTSDAWVFLVFVVLQHGKSTSFIVDFNTPHVCLCHQIHSWLFSWFDLFVERWPRLPPVPRPPVPEYHP
jgi:hypothetical protein